MCDNGFNSLGSPNIFHGLWYREWMPEVWESCKFCVRKIKVLLRRKFLFLFPSFFNINLFYMSKIIQIAKNWNDTCVRGLEISHWKVRKYRPPLQSSQNNRLENRRLPGPVFDLPRRETAGRVTRWPCLWRKWKTDNLGVSDITYLLDVYRFLGNRARFFSVGPEYQLGPDFV